MKKHIKNILFITIGMLVSFSSCNNEEPAKSTPAQEPVQGYNVTKTETLSSDHSLVTNLKNQAEVLNAINNFEQPDWNNVTLASYTNTPNKAVIAPIGKNKFLTCYVDTEHKLLRAFVITFEPTDARASSNEVHYVTPTGQRFLSIHLEEGAITNVQNYDNELNEARTAIDWKCFGACIGIAIRNLGGAIRAICSGCAIAPNPFTCGPCLAAIAGTGIACAIMC
jgi:hypothetical protein